MWTESVSIAPPTEKNSLKEVVTKEVLKCTSQVVACKYEERFNATTSLFSIY